MAKSLVCALACLAQIAVAAQATFYPNANLTDTAGDFIQAHSGAVIQDQNAVVKGNKVWYWFGQNNSADTSGDYFLGTSCYKTTDFVSWENQGLALKPIKGTNIAPSAVVERPKVLYNRKNDEYVMWFHSDNHDYSLAQVGIATSKTIAGPYKYKQSFYPLGHQSRDMTVWQDPDTDDAYLIFATDNNANLAVASLNEDYTNATKVLSNFTNVYWEAPGVMKKDDTFYLIFSRQAGWTPDPNMVMSASSMSGPWSNSTNIAPPASNTWLTQNGYDITINGTKKTTYIYLGDRWNGAELLSSTYSFMPLVFKDGQPYIHHTGGWTIDTETGEWSDLDFVHIEAANTSSSNLVPCGNGCAGGMAANMTNTTDFTFTWPGKAGNYVVQILYTFNGQSNQFLQLSASVGKKVYPGYALLESGGTSPVQQAPIPLKLKKGSTATFQLVDWEGSQVFIEGVKVYELLPGSSILPP